MKFNYDLTKNTFKYLNLFIGIETQKKKLKKNPNKKIKTATTQGLILLGYTLISFILLCLTIYYKNKVLETILYYITVVLLLLALSKYVATYIAYSYVKKANPKGTITISKDGIEDEHIEGITTKFNWNIIDLIIIKDNALMIIPKLIQQQIITTIQNKEIEKLITTCKKYNKEILIINKMEK